VKRKFIDEGRAILGEGVAAGTRVIGRGAGLLSDGSEIARFETGR
jgi:hypothetical protein